MRNHYNTAYYFDHSIPITSLLYPQKKEKILSLTPFPFPGIEIIIWEQEPWKTDAQMHWARIASANV